ncbi:hypothetical protein B0H14DRAFT_2577214 [Mycena olivaceomarginata]|nr:hypothetical protein B0H14DRAFT_2577214 [Mycena olivaceomarginata]
MSGSGVTYYNEELKMLLRLLKALPDTIPEGDLHDFRYYVLGPDQDERHWVCENCPQRPIDGIINIDPTRKAETRHQEAADPEDLMPEAKTQSKDNNNFSCPAQKVDERGKLEKVSEGRHRKSGDKTVMSLGQS